VSSESHSFDQRFKVELETPKTPEALVVPNFFFKLYALRNKSSRDLTPTLPEARRIAGDQKE
jgi:hypothetical protein